MQKKNAVSEESVSDAARKKYFIIKSKKSKLSQSNNSIILSWDVESLHKCSAPFVSSMTHSAHLTAKTNNHRMVWVGRDLKDHLVPTLPANAPRS